MVIWRVTSSPRSVTPLQSYVAFALTSMSAGQVSVMPTPSASWNCAATSRSTAPGSRTVEPPRNTISRTAPTISTARATRPAMRPAFDFLGGAP
jgi:hypothetical protein